MRISDWSSDVCSSDLLRVAFGQFAGTTPKRVLQSHADIASHGCCPGDNAHLPRARTEHRPFILIAEESVGGALHVHDIVGMAADPAQNAEAGLNEERCFHQSTVRSEEHTSELQSLMRISYAVFCLKKKNNMTHNSHE